MRQCAQTVKKLSLGVEAPIGGEAEFLYRNTPFHLAGGGTMDIQHMVIAQRGLGLPRD